MHSMPKHPAATLEAIKLLKPAARSGKSVLRTLQLRRTIREISPKTLSLSTISNLVWAACGLNRQKGPFGLPGRTAASASNSQEIDLYVALQKGTYRYDPLLHSLLPVIAGDLRPLAIGRGQTRQGDHAPARFVYVANVDRLANSWGFQEPGLKDPEVQRSYYYVDTGLIAANVYLFAASMGLAAWFHNCDNAALSTKLSLRDDQRALFGQTIGYPLKSRD